MIRKNKNILLLGLIFLLSFIVRFWGLGYSHFYGDETKVLYLDKTTPAFEFFMDQRKGPVQFLAVWTMEKLTGGHDELYMRMPFALAGFLSVCVFYLLSKKLFNEKVALFSTILFAFSGFNIAFSRTVQYQSFLILFGVLSIYLFVNKKYFLSALSLSLSFLSHYDAVFFATPLLYLMIDTKVDFKTIFTKFLFPLLVLVGLFYVPYIYKGYFLDNTVSYVSGRFVGDVETQRNYSAFTFMFYNPCLFSPLLLLLPLLLLFSKTKENISKEKSNINLLLFWFLVPFIIFQFLMTNPGTHIHNYLVSLYLLSGYTVVYFYDSLKGTIKKNIYKYAFGVVILLTVLRVSYVYLPVFNSGYPWNVPYFNNIFNKYQLFVYGFPYYRHWDEVADYFASLNRVQGVFTNDNDTIAEYYLRGIPYTRPGTNFLPQYYVYVKNNQEFLDYKPIPDMTRDQFYSNYVEVKRFGDDVVVYKRIEP